MGKREKGVRDISDKEFLAISLIAGDRLNVSSEALGGPRFDVSSEELLEALIVSGWRVEQVEEKDFVISNGDISRLVSLDDPRRSGD